MNEFETRFIRENFTFRIPTQIINLDYDQLYFLFNRSGYIIVKISKELLKRALKSIYQSFASIGQSPYKEAKEGFQS